MADPAGVVGAAPALDGGDVGEADAQAVGVVRAGALVAAHQVAAVPAHLPGWRRWDWRFSCRRIKEIGQPPV